MLIVSDIGIGPLDSFCLVVGEVTNLNFGNAQLLVQIILFLILILIVKKSKQTYIEILISLLSIFIITRMLNFIYPLVSFMENYNKYVVFAIGFVLYAIGIAINLKINILINPIDKLVVALSNIFSTKVGTMKLLSDLLFGILTVLSIVFLKVNVNISITTFFILFFTGPSINLINTLFLNKMDELLMGEVKSISN